MRLTKSADFALRIVLKLASSSSLCTMPQLSKELTIPYNNLSKLVQQLSRAQIIETKQGKNGGITLAKPSHMLSLKSVIDIIDGPTRLSECLNESSSCQFSCGCTLKSAFDDIQKKIDDLFDNVKLSHLIPQKGTELKKELIHEPTA